MTIEEIQTTINEIARPYADRRVNVFEVKPADVQDDVLRLQGRVLEEHNRQTLVNSLAGRYPVMRIDTSGVEVGRKTPARTMAVGTNLTSVHDGTSFLAEMVTQMLNGVPVEVLWQDGNWGFVRQPDGYLGWTYLPYLTDTPAPQATHLVIAPVSLLRDAPNAAAALVTRMLGGTGVCVTEQRPGWARLQLTGGVQGWLPLQDLRSLGALSQTQNARRTQMVDDAHSMTGVPYLWGGCSANGIDCSGFAQLLHRWIGITIPRDADMQYDAGQPVEPPFEVGDLLFFGEAGEQRRITHVTISLGGWRIIHSSRSRNGVQVDDVQAVPHLRDSFLCAATYIGR